MIALALWKKLNILHPTQSFMPAGAKIHLQRRKVAAGQAGWQPAPQTASPGLFAAYAAGRLQRGYFLRTVAATLPISPIDPLPASSVVT